MSSGSVTLKEWDSEYDTLHVAIDPARGGLHYSQITSLTARISELESRLERCAVGRSELRRRRDLLEKMKSRLSNAQASSNTTLRHLDHQRQVMQDHSRLVDDLGRGVERLNQQANIVHDEANLHTYLLFIELRFLPWAVRVMRRSTFR
eukprot:137377_1